MSNAHVSNGTTPSVGQGAQSSERIANKMWYTGSIVSTLAILFLLFDTVIKVLELAPAVDATVQLGYAAQQVLVIGIIEFVCLAVYLVPRTSVLGAILLTGYLGGAVATHLRVGSGLFSLVFPILVGALVWGGLYLRNTYLRALIPLGR